MAEREEFNVAAASPSAPHSPWHSPVPYLFGGLAAMFGLIAFALLILACSYWRLSGYLESGDGGEGGDRDLESGQETKKGGAPVMEHKFLVIMAGQVKPTFLATPVSSSRSSSFGNTSEKSCCCADGEAEKLEETTTGGGAEQQQHRQSSTQDH